MKGKIVNSTLNGVRLTELSDNNEVIVYTEAYVQELKQQLAEKDKEIRQLTSIEKDNKEYIRKLENTLDTYAKRTPIMSQVKIRNLQVDVEELKIQLEEKDRKIRKLVCEEIKDRLNNDFEYDCEYTYEKLIEILDQIESGEE